MNKIRVLVMIFIMYSIMNIAFIGIGETVSTTMPNIEIPDVDVPYAELLNDSQRSTVGIFKLGEYGLSKNINILDVYIDNEKHDTFGWMKKNLEGWDWLNPLNWNLANFQDIKKAWLSKYGTKENLSAGDDIYLYPVIQVKPTHYLHPNAWIVAGVFDAYSNDASYTSTYRQMIPLSSQNIEMIAGLYLGKMTQYDRYYIIDVIYTDVNLSGISISDILNYLIPEGKAQIAERYGGVIPGEIHVDAPSTVSFHELQLNKHYGSGVWGGITRIMDAWKTGMQFMTDTEKYGIAAYIINLLYYTPIIMVVGWILYTEAKSFIPFIRGGE